MHDRLQFSIRSTLLLTALFAAVLVVFLWRPSAASILARFLVGFLLMSMAFIAIDVTAAVARAFWIGVAAPLAMSAIWISLVGHQLAPSVWNIQYTAAQMQPVWQSFASALRVIPISCCLGLINGLLCALVYRLIWPQRAPASIPRLTFRLYGFFWLAVALVAIASFLGGMIFDRWRAALVSSDDEHANTSVFGSNDDDALEKSEEVEESMP